MNPGFLSLFSRSLYRGSAARLRSLEPTSEEYRHVHEERERFAASTIAFCLQCDDAFGSAVTVLESVRDKLGWPESFNVKAGPKELGIFLRAYERKKAVGGLAARLKRDNGMSQTAGVAWFGYQKRGDEREQRCVYVFCTKDRRKRLVNRLKAAKFVVDEQPGSDQDEGGGPYYAAVWEGNDKLDDITWFSTAYCPEIRAQGTFTRLLGNSSGAGRPSAGGN